MNKERRTTRSRTALLHGETDNPTANDIQAKKEAKSQQPPKSKKPVKKAAVDPQPSKKPDFESQTNADQEKCVCGEPFSDKDTKSISCDDCNTWWHFSCTGCSTSTLYSLETLEEAKFTCALCLITNISSNKIKQQLKEKLSDDKDTAQRQEETHRDCATCPDHLTQASSDNLQPKVEEDTTTTASAGANTPASDNGPPAPTHLDPTLQDTNNSPPHLTVILDGFIPPKYRNSRAIRKEINKHKPQIKFSDALSLHLGGIAIQCRDEQSKNAALEDWPEDAFDFAQVKSHLPASTQNEADQIKLVARNLPKPGDDNLLTEEIKRVSGSKNCSIRRFFNRNLVKYMPIAEVTVDSQAASQQLITNGIKLGKSKICFEPKRKQKIVRCFNCQKFGHSALQCSNDAVCVRCGENIDPAGHNCNHLNCANCNKQHSADSKHCEAYHNILKVANRNLLKHGPNPKPEH